jgi:hypothetical protein
MNYLKARQRQTDKRWCYTNMNDGEVYAVGYCHAFHELDDSLPVTEAEKEKHRANAHKYHTSGHATEDEACECYKRYLLDNRLRLNRTMNDCQKKCQICDTWTDHYATIGTTQFFILCPEHNTIEIVASLFAAPQEVWSS